MGVELEGGLVDDTGAPVKTFPLVNEGQGIKVGDAPFQELTCDAGESTIEVVTSVVQDRDELTTSLNEVLAHIPEGLLLILPIG